MRKQYKVSEGTSFRYWLEIFHDGERVDTKYLWTDELYDETEKLEQLGYTYGYTEKEVNDAREWYEKVAANVIKRENSNDCV